MARVVLIQAPPIWPMLEYELDIAVKESAEHDLYMVRCDKNRYFCPGSPFSEGPKKRHCHECQSRFDKGLDYLKSMDIVVNVINRVRFDEARIEEADDEILRSAKSTLMTQTRNASPREYLNDPFYLNILKEGLDNKNFILNILKKYEFERIYLFNGRITNYRPYMNYFKNKKLFIYEYPWVGFNRYLVLNGFYPHDLIKLSKDIHRKYQESKKNENLKRKIGDYWFKSRLKSKTVDATGAFNFEKDLKDLNLYSGYRYLVFYTSSEDEMGNVKEFYENCAYHNQLEAIKSISSNIPKDFKLIVRTHPRLIGINNEYEISIRDYCLNNNNIVYCPAESKVNSYKLISIADIVISFGSTIGVEAAYLGKFSIILSPAPYMQFGACKYINNHEELVRAINEEIDNNSSSDFYKNMRSNAAKEYAYGLISLGVKANNIKKNKYLGGKMLSKKYGLIEIRPNRLIYFYNRLNDRYIPIIRKLINKYVLK